MIFKNKGIYLDGASNTPVDKKVYKEMEKYFTNGYVGNSESIHDFGVNSAKVIDKARETISSNLEVNVEDVFFTSGATEGNNWVIKSFVEQNLKKNKKDRQGILCFAQEHDSVLKCCKQVEQLGIKVEYISSSKGDVKWLDVRKHLTPTSNIGLLCIMAVNNETGVINQIKTIIQRCKKFKIKTLVDCTQAIGYGGDFSKLGHSYPDATYMTFSSHKIYGPTGCGCLISKDHKLTPLITGGSQEKGLRGGTINLAGVVGMAKAVELICQNNYFNHYTELYNYLLDLCNKNFGDKVFVNANKANRQYNIISLNCSKICNCDNLASMLATYGIATSAGSACEENLIETDGVFNGSHVLKDLGMDEHSIRNTVRISFIKTTTKKDIDSLCKALKDISKIFNSKEE